MKYVLTAFLLFSAACAEPDLAEVKIVGDNLTDDELDVVMAQVRWWEVVGVVIHDGRETVDLDLPAIEVAFGSVPGHDAAAYPESLQVVIDDSIDLLDPLYGVLVTHETAHILFGSGAHLPDRSGIMSSPTYGWQLSEADLDYACHHAGWCSSK